MASDKHTTKASTAQPPPAISLPPRPSFDAVFGQAGASPGPMSLVSSFFAADTPDQHRSFSQLLAGAMASPLARTPTGFGGADGLGSPFFGGLFSPSGGLLSPNLPSGFFSPGPFGMSHQQALAQVTAQAALAQSHMHAQAEYPMSSEMVQSEQMSQQTSLVPIPKTQQQMLPSTMEPKVPAMDLTNAIHSDKRVQPHMTLDKPADDGYNWRKYGQKQVKGSEYPRSYYKCTHLSCPVKKKIERSLDGQITEIIYKGQHNHEIPQSNKRSRDGSDPNGSIKPQAKPDHGSHNQAGNLNSVAEFVSGQLLHPRDEETTQAAPIQMMGSCDGEEVDDCDVKLKDNDNDETHPKRSKTEAGPHEVVSSHKTVTEPKIIVQTRSEVDLLDDGYRWRKYGQKVVKGNPHPRSYYKCTYMGCNVRKHVERAPADPKAVITTYEGKHNHDVPASRGSSHNTANNNASRNTAVENASLHRGTNLGNNDQRPVVLQLKEEQVKV